MAKVSRRKAQAFTAPKNARTKAIVAQNSKTSPLLKLPEEIRQIIWGYAIGHQTVHIHLVAAQPDMCAHGPWSRFAYLVHTVCKATISDKEGHQLCQSEDYEKHASKLPLGQDLRISSNRHQNCAYNSGCEFLPLHILSVCHQFYIEANEMMWTTTTWSFKSPEVFEVFLLGAERKAILNPECFQGLNSIQKRLLKKVHIQVPHAYSKYMLGYWSIDKHMLSKAHPLDSLHLDIECSDETQIGGRVRLPHLNDFKVTLHRNFGPLELDWNDRKAWAENSAERFLKCKLKWRTRLGR